jgi:threonylcarbamoyladenosine tRNA methylthiotransferase MtaB
MKKIAFRTLGCRLNLYETDALASQFHEAHYQIVDFNENADVYVINTCTVTNQSDQKSRQTISQARKKSQDALVVVIGCMANSRKQSLLESGLVDYVIENEHKTALFNILESHFKGENSDFEHFDKDLFSYATAIKTFHTRSLIKIQDGCNNFCSYCIIPMVRGRATSRPVKNIIRNIREVIDHGFKEIVLTGVNISKYQDDKTNFEQLVHEILDVSGDFRLRISSIEPDNFSEHFVHLFENPKLAPHLHICLQSGSDSVLRRMNRHYSSKEFYAMAERFKTLDADFNLTTDIIVGFPGETESEFSESIQIAKELQFSHIHTFKYSVRSGTRAEKMPDQVPEKIKNQRSAVIRELSETNKRAYLTRLQGKTQYLLVERTTADGIARGYGEHYVPLRLKTKNAERNTFVDVKINGLHEGKELEGLAELI